MKTKKKFMTLKRKQKSKFKVIIIKYILFVH